MKLDHQREAQQRADRVAAFQAELAALEREEALRLTPEQRAGLDAHYERLLATLRREYAVDIDDSARRISWGMRIVSLLGAIAFFAGLVLFCHRVWGALPFWTQTGVLGVVPLLLLAATAWSFERGLSNYYGALLALAAGTAFVLGLGALGAIFNLAPSPHALLVWGLFAVLVAYASNLRLLLGCGLVLLSGYVGALGAAAGGAFWGAFMERPVWVLPAAALLYAMPRLTRQGRASDFAFVYRLCGAGVGLLALLVLSLESDVCCSVKWAPTVRMLYQLVGLGLSLAVVAHGLRLGRGGLVNLGAAGFVVFLLIRLHAWWWDWMPKYLFCLCIGLTALALLVAFRRVRRQLAHDEPWLRSSERGSSRHCGFGHALTSAATPEPPGEPEPTRTGPVNLQTGELSDGTVGGADAIRGKGDSVGSGWLWAAAGVLLIAADLGAVVSGVRNRQQARGGTVELTERELRLPGLFADSTVLLLDLQWTALSERPDRGPPAWLTASKLADLGFDCREPVTSPHARDHYGAMAPRPVYVVFEFEGEAWKQASVGQKPRTHLFAVDAGRDPDRLREKYPDPSRYLIVRGVIRPFLQTHRPGDDQPLAEPRLAAWIQEVQPQQVFVPRPHSVGLQALRRPPEAERDAAQRPPRYAVTLSWGAHYEPWVRSVRLLPFDAAPGKASAP